MRNYIKCFYYIYLNRQGFLYEVFEKILRHFNCPVTLYHLSSLPLLSLWTNQSPTCSPVRVLKTSCPNLNSCKNFRPPSETRDAGSNSHEFARIRIRPEFARIRGPLRIRIRNFKFEFPLDSLEFPRGLESIGTYNLPSPVCICPLPYGIKHFKSKSFHNLAIFVVCCCLHSPCLNYLTKIKTNQNEEFQISMYTPFLDSFKYLLEKKQQSMQNHQSTHKPSHVNHFLPLLGLHSLYSCIESWDLNSSKGEDNKYKGNIKQTSNGHSINIIIVMMLNNHHYVTVTVHCQIWTFSNLVTRISLRARSRRGQGVYQNEG